MDLVMLYLQSKRNRVYGMWGDHGIMCCHRCMTPLTVSNDKKYVCVPCKAYAVYV